MSVRRPTSGEPGKLAQNQTQSDTRLLTLIRAYQEPRTRNRAFAALAELLAAPRAGLCAHYVDLLGEDTLSIVNVALVEVLTRYPCEEAAWGLNVLGRVLTLTRKQLSKGRNKGRNLLGRQQETHLEEDEFEATPPPDIADAPATLPELTSAALAGGRIASVDAEILRLRAIGKNATEIGVLLGLKPARVRQRLSRAKRALTQTTGRAGTPRKARGLIKKA
jgi:hypothetical protein